MKKICYIIVFIYVTSFCYSQNIYKEYKGKKEEYLINFVFKNCHIKYNKTKDISLYGEKNIFEHFKIKSRIPVQAKRSNDKIKNKYANRKIKIGFNFKLDSGYIYYDTIFNILQKEIKNIVILNTKNNQVQDSFDSESCGVFLANDNYIMYIKSLNEKAEPYYILWFNTKIFYLEITGRRKSFDAISSFILNAFAVKTNINNNALNNGYKPVNVKSISLITQILDELKVKYTRKPISKKI